MSVTPIGAALAISRCTATTHTHTHTHARALCPPRWTTRRPSPLRTTPTCRNRTTTRHQPRATHRLSRQSHPRLEPTHRPTLAPLHIKRPSIPADQSLSPERAQDLHARPPILSTALQPSPFRTASPATSRLPFPLTCKAVDFSLCNPRAKGVRSSDPEPAEGAGAEGGKVESVSFYGCSGSLRAPFKASRSEGAPEGKVLRLPPKGLPCHPGAQALPLRLRRCARCATRPRPSSLR